MANRTYLINAKTLTSDCDDLYRLPVDRYDPPFIEVATASNAIPLPWFLCFRTEDLRRVRRVTDDLGELDKADGESIDLDDLIPCSTVVQAVANLRASLRMFEALADTPAIAKHYWKAAINQIGALPYPYLTLSVLEFVQSRDDHESFVRAFSADESAVPHLKSWAGRLEGDEEALSTQIYFKIPTRPPELELTALEISEVARFPGVNPRWLEFRRRWSADGPCDEDGDRSNRAELADYASNGYGERWRNWVRQYGSSMKGAENLLADWEHFGDGDLMLFARLRLREMLGQALRIGEFNAVAASRAFSAAYLATCIDLHFHEQYTLRMPGGKLQRLPRDSVAFAALGFVVGADAQAARLVGGLVTARSKGYVRDSDTGTPNLNAMLDVMASASGLGVEPMTSPADPKFSRLLTCVLAPNAKRAELESAWLATCDLHTHFPVGVWISDPWALFPIEQMLMNALRNRAGLEPLDFDHPFLAPAFRGLPKQTGWQLDELVVRAHQRMTMDGFSDARILAQMMGKSAAPSLALRAKSIWNGFRGKPE